MVEHEGIRPFAALQGVVAAPAVQQVVAFVPFKIVVSVAAEEEIVALFAVKLVISEPAEEPVVALSPVEVVFAVAAEEPVVALFAVEIVVAAERFIETSCRRFPVMNDGRLAGVISRNDLLRAFQVVGED